MKKKLFAVCAYLDDSSKSIKAVSNCNVNCLTKYPITPFRVGNYLLIVTADQHKEHTVIMLGVYYHTLHDTPIGQQKIISVKSASVQLNYPSGPCC